MLPLLFLIIPTLHLNTNNKQMKRCKQYRLMATAMAMLLIASCQREELIDRDDSGKLQFHPTLDGAHSATRAAESDKSVLQKASAAGENSPHIAIETYTGAPGSSLKPYFSDKLGYSATEKHWDVNSGIPRFLPTEGMNLYAYFATGSTGVGDLTNVDYSAPATADAFPKLTFAVAADEALQVDLIAAKVEGVSRPDIMVPFRHILSQINFGVKGMDYHQIIIKNIRINNVMGSGFFDYGTWGWAFDTDPVKCSYPYYFPDRRAGEKADESGKNYQTLGSPDDSKNSYIFGDGGKFGPGGDDTFLYALINPAASCYATQKETTTALHNSLMLLPQKITENAEATVTLDYEIRLNDQVVRSGQDNVRLDAYYDWDPNLRYVYLFNFNNPSQKVTFEVLVDEWQYYDGNNGIVGTEELTGKTLFEKHVRSLRADEGYSVPIGALNSDFICDWSLYALENSFTKGESFTLSFESPLPFINGKSVIIHPPFGFTASASSVSAPGTVTFTAPYSYYTTLGEVNEAIKSGSGNYVFNVSNSVLLEDIVFVGSDEVESSLTLRYLSAYTDTRPDRWSMYDPKTAVYFPKDFALTNSIVPYGYKVYTVAGLKAVFDWLNSGGPNPGGSNSALTPEERMQTNITLVENGLYNLAEVYKANADDTKPAFMPIGTYNSNPYSGTFDGKGATVSNLYINSTSDFQGFFAHKSGIVENLNLTNVSVTSTANHIGGIAGVSSGNTRNCSVTGSVTGNWNVGGIAGSNWTFVFGCRSAATVSGAGVVGGIAGACGDIRACYFTGTVNGPGGGIAGDGTNITSSYYVAKADIGTNNPDGTRLPSVAVLNGKIAELNGVLNSGYINTFKYVSGNLDNTPPSTLLGYPNPRANGGVLKGTFIQNWFALYWGQERWNEEMALLATLGMEYLVIDQVMECYVPDPPALPKYMSWYPATESVLVNNALKIDWGTALEKCMSACRAHGIKLYIGTFFDKRFWDGGAAVKGKEAEWDNSIATANKVMDELISFYFNGSSSVKGDFTDVLAGWYFPYEVDDLSFQSDDAKRILKEGISTTLAHRTNHSNQNARKPYLFSPFMNGAYSSVPGTMDAAAYGVLWRDIMSSTGFRPGDILSPQDCIGIGKLTLSELDTWMPELKKAVPNGVEFWINVELFGPGGDASFLTSQQIPANHKYASKLISFSYPIYYSPNAGGYRQGDHKAYKLYYDAQ